MHSHAKALDEHLQLVLFASYCLHLLTFAAGDLKYNKQQNLYFNLLHAANSLLSDLFWLHYGDYYSTDDCLRRVFGPRYVAVNAVYTSSLD